MKIFSVYDSKAEAFLQPFFAQTDAVAVRLFSSACCDEDHNFHRFPGDYTLFSLGEFDEQSGAIATLDTPYNLGLALVHQPSETARPKAVAARSEEANHG